MKKIFILFILLSVALSGCSAEKSFNDYILDFVKENETISKLNKILSVIEIEDAKIGVSLVENIDSEVILYLSSMIIDENEGITFDFHGNHIPLSFHQNNNKRIWTWYNLNEEVFMYEEDSTPNHKYVYGILDGNKENMSYSNKIINQKTVSFNYMNTDVDITLWIIQLDKNEDFILDSLKY